MFNPPAPCNLASQAAFISPLPNFPFSSKINQLEECVTELCSHPGSVTWFRKLNLFVHYFSKVCKVRVDLLLCRVIRGIICSKEREFGPPQVLRNSNHSQQFLFVFAPVTNSAPRKKMPGSLSPSTCMVYVCLNCVANSQGPNWSQITMSSFHAEIQGLITKEHYIVVPDNETVWTAGIHHPFTLPQNETTRNAAKREEECVAEI